jgi:hypothetical protein
MPSPMKKIVLLSLSYLPTLRCLFSFFFFNNILCYSSLKVKCNSGPDIMILFKNVDKILVFQFEIFD